MSFQGRFSSSLSRSSKRSSSLNSGELGIGEDLHRRFEYLDSSSSDVRFAAVSCATPEGFGAIDGYGLRCDGALSSAAVETDEERRWRGAEGGGTGEKAGMYDRSELPGYERTSGV